METFLDRLAEDGTATVVDNRGIDDCGTSKRSSSTVFTTMINNTNTAVADFNKDSVVVSDESPFHPQIISLDASSSNSLKGDRWAISAPDVDFSGRWQLIISDEFKKENDKYLERLGQPKIVRSIEIGRAHV